MGDFLDVLARDAEATIASGYYEHTSSRTKGHVSLKEAITRSKFVALIAEVKPASPSAGIIREDLQPEQVAARMASGGAAAISVLTEPKHFNGSLDNLIKVQQAVSIPVLMKDIILSPEQLDAAADLGADAVLLIMALFDRGYCELSLREMISEAHRRNLEVLLETHNEAEFRRAAATAAEVVGINNRDLGTLRVDLNVTTRILSANPVNNKVVVSESGINTAVDIGFLRRFGAQGFLVGSAIMKSNNIEEKVRELVQNG